MPVEYPGCNSRLKETKHSSISDLAAGAVEGLLPLMEGRKFVLYGHSLGAWVTWEVAQLLQSNPDPAGPRPAAVFVSGVRSPSLTGIAHDPDGTEMHRLEEGPFWEAYERRYGKNPDLVRCV